MIKDGDIVTDVSGKPVYVKGIDEVLQRVKLTLSTVKGEFVYNKSFGCEPLRLSEDERLLKNIEAQLREAIINISGARLELLSAKSVSEGLLITFSLWYGKENVRSEVVVK